MSVNFWDLIIFAPERQKSAVERRATRCSRVATRVKTEDLLKELKEISRSLSSLVHELPESAPPEFDVWTCYATVEKDVAILKLRMGVERPGVVVQLPRAVVAIELLPKALAALDEARSKLESGELAVGLDALRASRNDLRAYLSELGRTRSRARRKARATRPSS